MKRGAQLFVGCMLLGPLGLGGQTVECPEWVIPPGGSNPEDWAPHRCALKVQPDLGGHLATLPAPRFRPRAGVRVTVFILEDGSVDPEFTRMLTRSGDRDFADRFLESLRRIHLSRKELGDVSSRFGFDLVVETERRSDSIPEELRWEYRKGTLSDTLHGWWVPAPPEPEYSSREQAAVLRRVTDQLIAMRVVTPEHNWGYCLLVEDGDPASTEAVQDRLRRNHGWSFTQVDDCYLDVRTRRLIFEKPLRTGHGRTVVRVSGDHLENWPPGFDGRFFPSWTAYCSLLDGGNDTVDCQVNKVQTDVPELDRSRHPEVVGSRKPAVGPLRVELLIHGADLYLTDTIVGETDRVFRVEDLAVHDPGHGRCTGGASLSAVSTWEPEGQRLLRIELDPVSGLREASVTLVSVYKPDPKPTEFRLECGGRVDQPLAATILEGVGPPFRGPVALCIDYKCERSVEVPIHQPLPSALHVSFADLRPEAWNSDGALMFKVGFDRSIGGLIPILIIGSGEDLFATVLVELEDGSYRMSVSMTPGFTADSELRLYLIQR